MRAMIARQVSSAFASVFATMLVGGGVAGSAAVARARAPLVCAGEGGGVDGGRADATGGPTGDCRGLISRTLGAPDVIDACEGSRERLDPPPPPPGPPRVGGGAPVARRFSRSPRRTSSSSSG